MNKDYKDKWIAALRSGQYPQTKGSLINEEGKVCYCALGVLADIVVREFPNKYTWVDNEYLQSKDANDYPYDNYWDELPNSVVELTGLTSGVATLTYGNETLGIDFLNDEGYDFDELADIIEANL
jgi:hypothetical protein